MGRDTILLQPSRGTKFVNPEFSLMRSSLIDGDAVTADLWLHTVSTCIEGDHV